MTNYEKELEQAKFWNKLSMGCGYPKYIHAFEELVYKSKPITPIEETEYGYSYDNGDHLDGQPSYSIKVYRCPICKNAVRYSECCHNNDCRQAMDWTENGETK